MHSLAECSLGHMGNVAFSPDKNIVIYFGFLRLGPVIL